VERRSTNLVIIAQLPRLSVKIRRAIVRNNNRIVVNRAKIIKMPIESIFLINLKINSPITVSKD
jgi:hypothetical protein